ncbi:fimbrial protein [Serratia nevei]|uniref:fimbrial protein n=1 Tax=Serratia nevei TaxID=2703794 RepID=UPI0020A14152|nr:fimbrial protein [Serratia nevei]MCP1106590.1 fimbrial protein [Serratia nevei]
MFRIIALTLSIVFSGYSYASCYGNGIQYAPPIYVDLSDKLSDKTPVWEGSFYTQYGGSFSCTTSNSEFGYTRILSTDSSKATILGFGNGKYWVRAEITNDVANKKLSGWGTHSASELNMPMNIRFSLVNKTGTSIPGDTVSLKDVMFVTDLSGMSLVEILLWPAKQLIKILTWLFNGFNWPYDQRDMYGQPMTIKYAPKMTTCSFDNAGLAVKLPTLGISQISQGGQNGLTPFTLNFSCQNRQSGGTADRDIKMFLSSNNLLPSDNTVLIDKSAAAAKGIGIRLVRMTAPNSPVSLALSNVEQGTATSLFHVGAGNALEEKFSLGMAAYYYPYSIASMSSGGINTSATLNIIYK